MLLNHIIRCCGYSINGDGVFLSFLSYVMFRGGIALVVLVLVESLCVRLLDGGGVEVGGGGRERERERKHDQSNIAA